MRKLIVERIEDGVAVLEEENGEQSEIDSALLPEGTKEGELLSNDDGTLKRLTEETEKRRESIHDMLKKLMERNKK